MSSTIKIENFGPIKRGYTDNNGFIPIQKYMTLIGKQGSGKSTVVKLISTFSWMEKALFQGKIQKDELLDNKIFKQYFANQNIENYFLKPKKNGDGTLLVYRGDAYTFIYDNKLRIENNQKKVDYSLPKITFVSSERNLLSVLEQTEKLKPLPPALNWLLEEFLKARRDLKLPVELPINDLWFRYDKAKRTSFIHGKENDHTIKLSEAASGVQSVVPLFIVLDYINKFIRNQKDTSYSEEERENLRNDLDKILRANFPRTVKDEAIKVLFDKYKVNYLLNIIEEIEQNLFPDSQRAILYKVLEYTNNLPENKLILTTHSPYIISYLTLAMQGYLVKEKIRGDVKLKKKLERIVPLKSCINPEEVGIYEIDLRGCIRKLQNENGIVSDNNYLNNIMANTNLLFAELLQIEQDATEV